MIVSSWSYYIIKTLSEQDNYMINVDNNITSFNEFSGFR